MTNNNTSSSFIAPHSIFAGFYRHISRHRRFQFLILLSLTLTSAFAEVLSLGIVVPFIGILTQPEVVFAYPAIAGIINFFEIRTAAELVLPLTIIFALAAFLAGILRLTLLKFSIRYANAIGADFGTDAYHRTLHQPYIVHISRNSSEIISGITQKIGTATGVLLCLVTIITSLVLFIAIFFTLVLIDPMVASISIVTFGIGYGVIAWMTRHRLLRNSQYVATEQTQVVKTIQEGLGGIRDILLDGTQSVYSQVYSKSFRRWLLANGENNFINAAPRYAAEALGMIIIALLAYYLSLQPEGIGKAFPVLGAFALGAQRLLPVLQQLYGNWVIVKGSQAALVDVLELLEQPLPDNQNKSKNLSINFQKEISFENVYFKYTSAGENALSNVNLTIQKGKCIGIIGITGSGKSTITDLIMALLEPSQGNILVDGVPINSKNRKEWQQTIAHVPQSIFLTDASFAENIAFGIPLDQIDMTRVKQAADKAQISDFIDSHSDKYNTMVGERGVRMSGGQRQRVGIARALYKNVDIIILDEATSALDNLTEEAVMKSIESYGKKLTILIVAHRLTTLKNCSQIVELDKGKITRKGSYQDIINNGE